MTLSEYENYIFSLSEKMAVSFVMEDISEGMDTLGWEFMTKHNGDDWTTTLDDIEGKVVATLAKVKKERSLKGTEK